MISILVPTRNRPDNIVRMYDSAMRTADEPTQIQFSFYIDNDDVLSPPVLNKLGRNVIITRGPRIILSQMWNVACRKATGDIFMHGGDDIVFQSQHWDSLVKKHFDAYPDKIVFVYGEDTIQHGFIGTHGFLHRNWVDTVGYFVPPYFSSDYNDTWLTDVSRMIGRSVYDSNIITEHFHWSNGKAPLDITHSERLERHARDNVEQIYNDTLDKRIEDAAKLKRFIEGFSA